MAQLRKNPFDEVTLSQLKDRTSVKWRAYDPDVLPLWVAEMDVVPDPIIANAVHQAMIAGDTGYPARAKSLLRAPSQTRPVNHEDAQARYQDLPRYGSALSDFAAQQWAWHFDPSQTRPVSDVMHGIFHLVAALAPTGVVAVNDPVYPPFTSYPQYAGATVITAGMTNQGRLDFDELDRAFPQADIFLLCNPHNPGGAVHTRQELEQLLALAAHHEVRVISDEVHGPLTSIAAEQQLGRDIFVPILSVPGSERAFAVTSAAKGWNLAGFKAALIVAGEEAIADFAQVFPQAFESASHLAIIAHTAAIMGARPWLTSVRHAIDINRGYFQDQLASRLSNARVYPAQATYLAWVDLSKVTTASGKELGPDPAKFLLQEARVAVNSGLTFGPAGAQHVRFNVGTAQSNLDIALDRITHALAKN